MSHFRCIDGLRAWLAWIVVFAHIALLTTADIRIPLLHALVAGATYAVSIFIIISGFVITHLLLEQRESYGPYIARRSLRIYPLYIVCLCAGIFATHLHFLAFADRPWGDYIPQPDLIAAETRSLAGHGFFWNVLAHLTLLQGAIPNGVLEVSEYAFLGPAWSLSLEWQFYLVAPLILVALANPSGRILVSVGAVACYAAFRLGWLGEFYDPSFLPGAVLPFATGIATRLVFTRLPKLTAYPVAGITIALGFIGLSHDLLPFVFWFAFVACMHTERPVDGPGAWVARSFHRAFNSKPAVFLGKRSYSTYLVHEPIINVIVYICITRFALGMWLTVLCALIAVPLLTVLASVFLFRFVEAPAISFGKGLFTSRGPPLLSA
jgi:peptidoglycan/LPS O-acetylase OafA/YrhL